MYLPNEGVMKGVDPRTTPQVKYGDLNPEEDFHMEPLISMVPGSMYISVIYENQPCRKTVAKSCLWIKESQTGGGACSSPGSCSDWKKQEGSRIFCGNMSPCGSAEFNCKQVGTIYLQAVSGANAAPTPSSSCGCAPSNCGCGNTASTYVWFKVADQGATEDWLLLSPNIVRPDVLPIAPFSDECDQEMRDYLNGLPVGSTVLHLDGNKCLIGEYIKLSCVCADIRDWLNKTAACVIKGSGDPNVEPLECIVIETMKVAA